MGGKWMAGDRCDQPNGITGREEEFKQYWLAGWPGVKLEKHFHSSLRYMRKVAKRMGLPEKPDQRKGDPEKRLLLAARTSRDGSIKRSIPDLYQRLKVLRFLAIMVRVAKKAGAPLDAGVFLEEYRKCEI